MVLKSYLIQKYQREKSFKIMMITTENTMIPVKLILELELETYSI